MLEAKPFIKWVGGKGQLITQLDSLLPANFAEWEDATYIEPFVGGGAMLFHMLSRYPNIRYAVINDINQDLTTCYKTVRDDLEMLLQSLRNIEGEYHKLVTQEAKSDFYYMMRTRFNTKNLDDVENTTLFFFLNRTCFNGLFRVNKSGAFNVPFGKYEKPSIYNEDILYADSMILQKVEIMTGDFDKTYEKIRSNTLFYFDPPYRPLSDTSSFNNYSKEDFDDMAQIRLKQFCDRVHKKGAQFMLSNSDCLAKDGRDNFFDSLYSAYQIDRVWAARSINSNPSKRGKLTELLIHNFFTTNSQEQQLNLLFA